MIFILRHVVQPWDNVTGIPRQHLPGWPACVARTGRQTYDPGQHVEFVALHVVESAEQHGEQGNGSAPLGHLGYI